MGISFHKMRVFKSNVKIKIIGIIVVGLFVWFWFCLPSQLFDEPSSFVVEDNSGNLLSASIAADGQWRFPDEIEVPEKFIKCITTFEDKRFYYHPGVDPIALGRAVFINLKNRGTVQGGSTLTMQVMRLSRKKNKRNLWQKLIESIQSVRLEFTNSKKKIMSLYASHAPFGGNVVGLEAASWRYYGRDAEKLSWGEMAALAVLPNSPSLVHPGKNSATLLKKRNQLLDKLLANKTIDSSTCYLSKLEPLPSNPLPLPQLAPHLLQRFKNDYFNNKISNASVKTTIDGNLQSNVIDILNRHHKVLAGNGINNICALVLDVETGNTLAYVGNVYDTKNPELESDVDVIKAPRSPGSTLKPILFASALSEGMLLPQMLLPDVPTQIGGYTPQNYDRNYDGAVPASNALSRSLNIPAVKILQQYKYARFYDLLKQLGMSTLNRPADNYGLSLILGGGEVNMWEMAGIYAGMARTLNHQIKNNGLALKKDFFLPKYVSVEDESNQQKSDLPINSLDATSIWFTFQAMEEVMRPGEEGLWQQFSSSQKIAWKTGTSFGFRDAWAIGITSKYVVAVWAGNTDGEGRAGLIGVQAAGPVLFDIFRLLPSSKWFSAPQNNFSFVPICRQSGFRANLDCPDVDTIMVSKNGIKSPLCPYHQIVHLDKTGNFQVNENCISPSNMIHQSWFVLPPTMEWYYKQKNHDYKVLPPFLPGCDGDNFSRQMDLTYPLQNAKIYVPLEIDGQRGRTIFTARHRDPQSVIYWHLDNQFVGSTSHIHQMDFSPSPGKHVVTIVDEKGNSISRNFEILTVKQ
jgi:penicillin-binding protein 1C